MADQQLGEFMRREYRKMVNYVRRLLDSAADMDAEDFVQDVLVNVLERADPAQPLEHLAAYVYRSLRNRVVDFFRTRKAMVPIGVPEGAGDAEAPVALRDKGADPLTALDTKDISSRLYAALQRLKPIERDVIVANEFEGIGFKELAGMWNMPVNTLLSHKNRGVAKLRQYMAPGASTEE